MSNAPPASRKGITYSTLSTPKSLQIRSTLSNQSTTDIVPSYSGTSFRLNLPKELVVEFFLFNSNQDCYTQKCTAFMPQGPTLMQMSMGLAFGPVTHAHCHFCICHHDIYLITHSLQEANGIFWQSNLKLGC